MIKLPIEIGDVLLGGRFKNKPMKVRELGVDSKGQPTVNGKGLLKNRIPKTLNVIKQQREKAKEEGKPFNEEEVIKKIKEYFYGKDE